MKLATWNVNSIRARIDLLGDWLARCRPDVVCLQETKVVDEQFPGEALAAAGYRTAFTGERTYNGVAILSLEPLEDVRVEFPLEGNQDHRLISGLYHGIRVYSAYFPNGRDPASEHFVAKLQWIERLGDLLFGPGAEGQKPGARPQVTAPPSAVGPADLIALLGDFNVAPEQRDVYDPESMEGRIHFTLEERSAIGHLLDRGLVDAFRVRREEPGLYSWWDYRQGAFRRNLGLRIDHVFTSPVLAEKVADAFIDVEERRKPSCSDHAPVVVELDL